MEVKISIKDVGPDNACIEIKPEDDLNKECEDLAPSHVMAKHIVIFLNENFDLRMGTPIIRIK